MGRHHHDAPTILRVRQPLDDLEPHARHPAGTWAHPPAATRAGPAAPWPMPRAGPRRRTPPPGAALPSRPGPARHRPSAPPLGVGQSLHPGRHGQLLTQGQGRVKRQALGHEAHLARPPSVSLARAISCSGTPPTAALRGPFKAHSRDSKVNSTPAWPLQQQTPPGGKARLPVVQAVPALVEGQIVPGQGLPLIRPPSARQDRPGATWPAWARSRTRSRVDRCAGCNSPGDSARREVLAQGLHLGRPATGTPAASSSSSSASASACCARPSV